MDWKEAIAWDYAEEMGRDGKKRYVGWQKSFRCITIRVNSLTETAKVLVRDFNSTQHPMVKRTFDGVEYYAMRLVRDFEHVDGLDGDSLTLEYRSVYAVNPPEVSV